MHSNIHLCVTWSQCCTAENGAYFTLGVPRLFRNNLWKAENIATTEQRRVTCCTLHHYLNMAPQQVHNVLYYAKRMRTAAVDSGVLLVLQATWMLPPKSLSSCGSQSNVFLISDSVGCRGLFFPHLSNEFLFLLIVTATRALEGMRYHLTSAEVMVQ